MCYCFLSLLAASTRSWSRFVSIFLGSTSGGSLIRKGAPRPGHQAIECFFAFEDAKGRMHDLAAIDDDHSFDAPLLQSYRQASLLHAEHLNDARQIDIAELSFDCQRHPPGLIERVRR